MWDAHNNDHAPTRDDADWTPERLSRASYKELGSPQEYERRFMNHLLSSTSCATKLRGLLAAQSRTTRDFSLEIDAFDLLQSDPVLGHFLLAFPTTLLQMLEVAIVSAQRQLLKEGLTTDESNCTNWTVKGDHGDGKSRVHARLVHLPPMCCKLSLASLQASDVGKIIQCSGTVVRTTPVCMYESSRYFRCTGKQGCGKKFLVQADLEQRANLLEQPQFCSAGGQEACKGRNFQPIDDGALHTDYQEVTIQETASQLGGASVPRSLLIKLQHDLVDRCQPGDEVIVVGMLISQWHQALIADADCTVGMALHAHSIRVVQDKCSSAWSNVGTSSSDGSSAADFDDDKFRQEFMGFWEHPRSLERPIEFRDFICQAVCPKLYGLAIIKLALLMTLIGGVSHGSDRKRNNNEESSGDHNHPELGANSTDATQYEMNDAPEPFQIVQNETTTCASSYYGIERPQCKGISGYAGSESVQTRRRGQSHLLLVGDPGTGKSQFLRFAAAICPRSVLTTGIGTTSAGLTCAAVREGNGKEFSLEAGALVLADQGVCCIDEFGCIQDQDRTTIHEAMEQQTLSVAKAGIVCKLNCRATIVAVMNPRDCVYDNQASLSRNTGLGTPLLSRFDLIFKLVDSSDIARDCNVTTYLLNRAIQNSGVDCSATRKDSQMDAPWTMEKLRAYISFVREKFQPVMSDDAAMLLERHYEKNRASQSTTMPVTVRFLESLIRLSQAHARLMFRKVVTLLDAVAVIRVMECTAMAYGGFEGNDDFENALYSDPMAVDFTENPDLDFWCFEFRILHRYGMGDRMSAEKQRVVHEALGHTFGGEPTSSSCWNDLENARDAQNAMGTTTNAAPTGRYDRKRQRKG